MFKVVKDSIKLNLPIPARSFYDIIFNNFMITYGQSCAPSRPIWSLSLILCGVECNNSDPLQHLTQIFFARKKRKHFWQNMQIQNFNVGHRLLLFRITWEHFCWISPKLNFLFCSNLSNTKLNVFYLVNFDQKYTFKKCKNVSCTKIYLLYL